MKEQSVLEEFLNLDLSSAESVLMKFAKLDNAQYHGTTNDRLNSFVYIPGSREDRVVLVAHADTVFTNFSGPHEVIFEDGYYRSDESLVGIGADDRAGCAILYLLKDLGHSLLITDGEEKGRQGAERIKEDYPDLYRELNEHQYMIEFDRGHDKNYKVYNIPVSRDFKEFIEKSTRYKEADPWSYTDINVLCDKICGANLSVGYYDWHKESEILVYDEWKRTLDVSRKMLAGKQKKFPLVL